MKSFDGFPQGEINISIPVSFFSDILPEINNIGEMKVTLYAFWFLQNQEGENPFITYADFRNDPVLMGSLAEKNQDADVVLRQALLCAVKRGCLLQQKISGEADDQELYFLNSPQGRASLQRYSQGSWDYLGEPHISPTLAADKYNIFRIYEDNIGALTPIIAETLIEAETIYPNSWIVEAIQIAVENNVRKWRYIEAVLKSWLEGGRNGTHRQNSEEDHRRYVKGEFGDFGEY
jgi:DNA replication protein